MTSSTASAQGGATPTSAEVSEYVRQLIAEVHEILSSDRWAVLDSRTDRTKWLLYDAASLRHCCALLSEIESAVSFDQEWSVRVLGRVHLEAWFRALYLHFGGYQALARIAQDTRYQLERTDEEIQRFNEQLARNKKSVNKRLKRVRESNAGIDHWNRTNPDRPPKASHVEPTAPKLNHTQIDLSELIKGFNDSAQQLPVSTLVDHLTKLSIEKDIGAEDFRSLYIIYRKLSTSVHPTLETYDSYLIQTPVRSSFIHTSPAPRGLSYADPTRRTALYGTAYLASAVLGADGYSTPIANEIMVRLNEDLSQATGQTPTI